MVSTCDVNQGHRWSDNPLAIPDLLGWSRTLIDFLLYSSIFMGMQGMGMVYASCLIQGLELTPAVLAIMLLVPFSVYNMNRKTDEEEDSVNHPGRYQFTKRFEKSLEYGALVTYALAVLIAVPFGWATVLVTLVDDDACLPLGTVQEETSRAMPPTDPLTGRPVREPTGTEPLRRDEPKTL